MEIHNHTLTTAEELGSLLSLTEAEKSEIDRVRAYYPMKISPYYASLMDTGSADSPIRRLCVPCSAELDNPNHFEDDPLHEGAYCPVPYLTHKYPDRAAFYICNSCFTYCRHCTRKNTVLKAEAIPRGQFEAVLDYLRKTPQVRDVLVTGGDPLTLSDDELDYYLCRLRTIPHVQTLRIGSRAPVVQPSRITQKLADTLAKHHPLWLNTHFNHPSEITPEAAEACSLLLSRGIPLGNQSVLLKGVNDDIDVMEQLVLALTKIRVRPYYIYQCDNVRGTSHFHTPYTLGMDMIRELRKRVSGYAVPRFVIDVPGPSGGKVTMEHPNLIEDNGRRLLVYGPDGNPVEYEPGGKL